MLELDMWMANGIAPAMPPAIADMRHGGLVPPVEGSISAKCFGQTTRPSGASRISLRARAVPQTAQVPSMRVASHRSAWPQGWPPLTAEMLDTAIARADGNVVHAVMLHDTLRDLPAEQRQTHRI